MNAPPVAPVMSAVPSILAHQGGWDEILLVVGPLALIAGALWLANRRVSAQLDAIGEQEAEGAADAGSDGGDVGSADDGDHGR